MLYPQHILRMLASMGAVASKKKMHFDEFVEGEQLISHFSFTPEDIVHFAERYDEQDMHLSEELAKHTPLGGLIASGWQTATVTINRWVQDHVGIASGVLGMGLESLRWAKPIWPNDPLKSTVTVLEKRHSKSRPGYGVLKVRCVVTDSSGEIALEMVVPTMIKI